MNVLCPKCQALFRVDPERVPSAGARVRCARCSEVFLLTRQGALPLPAAAPAAAGAGGRVAPGPAATPPRPVMPAAGAGQAAAPSPPAPGAQPVAAAPPVSRAPAEAVPAAKPAPGGIPAPTAGGAAAGSSSAGTAARPRRSFAVQDPDARAQRIARALVSDIVAYHPERRDKSLAAGTLRGEFREEIVKSWEEYVAQVGAELAKKTPHFRNALNEILAKGQSIF